ncbi:hypothetical protein ACWF95_28225 [Streptomyces vinaceus]
MSAGVNQVDYRFTVTVSMTSGSGERVADVKVVIVARFSVSGDSEPGLPVLNAFGNEIAIMAAYPYLRQHTQDLAGRIGFHNLTLGLLKKQDGKQAASASLDLLMGT